MATPWPESMSTKLRADASPTAPEFRKMIEEGGQPNASFRVILVWKFSRFTRKREHAVAFKSMLRRKGRPGGVHHRAR